MTAADPLPTDPVAAAFARLAADGDQAEAPHPLSLSRSIQVIRAICFGLLTVGLLVFVAAVLLPLDGGIGEPP